MVILALETVTRAGSLALCTDDGTGPAMSGDPSRTHGVRLPGELQRFVEAHGESLQNIDYFAVVTGPGSFTGLRIGLATVQGLAFANGRATVGIPTLEALASGWLDAHPNAAGLVAAVLDAARGEVFYAAWDVTEADSIESSVPRIEARVAAPEQVAHELATLRGDRRLTLVGPGAAQYAERFAADLPGAEIDHVIPNLAAAAGRLAVRRVSSATPPHALRPVYVRRPDAEVARDRIVRSRAMAVPTEDGVDGLDVFEVTTPGDVAEVARVQERAFGDGWGADAFGGELATLDVARLYGARAASGELVAYCACWQVVNELHINSLAVDPLVRRRGIAKALLRRVMALAAAAGATGATLEVRESNHAGRALYEGLGFKVEGVRRGYYQNPREDALVLWHRGPALW